jgi:hypothetical protein
MSKSYDELLALLPKELVEEVGMLETTKVELPSGLVALAMGLIMAGISVLPKDKVEVGMLCLKAIEEYAMPQLEQQQNEKDGKAH